MDKMKWVSPILTVLTRVEDGSERVLANCKEFVSSWPRGPISSHNACWWWKTGEGCLVDGCKAIVQS